MDIHTRSCVSADKCYTTTEHTRIDRLGS
jgi:hypothetical protein